MSNRQVVTEVYEAFARGDVPSVLARFRPDVEWRLAESHPYAPDGKPWVGPDEIARRFFMRAGGEWERFAIAPERWHEAGETVVVECRYHGVYRPTGRTLDAQVCHVWTLREGKVQRFQQYADTARLSAVMGALPPPTRPTLEPAAARNAVREEESVMGPKGDALQAAERAYGDLRSSFDGLEETALERPWLGVWGVREIVAHTAGWHHEMTPALERLGRGASPFPEGTSYDDVDGWNARFVEARRGVKVQALVDELDASHAAFMRAARALPDAQFAAGAQGREVFEGSATGHYREHATQIRDWRKAIGA